MIFVCEAYLQLLEKVVPSDVSNNCPGKSVLDLPGQITIYNPPIKVNSVFVRNNKIYPLCESPAKLLGAAGDIPLPALQDAFHLIPGAAGKAGFNA